MELHIGDKIAHPIYGAGIVRTRCPITYNGSIRDVYVIEFPTLRMEIYVPVNGDEKFPWRPIAVAEELTTLAAILQSEPQPLPAGRRERQAWLEAHLNAANISRLAEIVRDLSALIRIRPSAHVKDRQTFDQALKLLSTEWALAANISFYEARLQIDQILNLASAVAATNDRPASPESSGTYP